jgi:hypothetical protein
MHLPCALYLCIFHKLVNVVALVLMLVEYAALVLLVLVPRAVL